MKAFIGHDFDDENDQLVSKIITHIDAHGIKCVHARKAESGLVDEKVTDLIRECAIFVGIFTRDKPFMLNDSFWNRIFPGKSMQYSTSMWVVQESGFALGTGKKLILLIEEGVVDFPQLHGNIQYIKFERDSIQDKFTTLSQMISSIKTKLTGGVAEMAPEESKQAETTIPKEEELQQKQEGGGEWKVVFTKISNALCESEGYIEAQRIFRDEGEAVLDDEDEKLFWRAVILRLSQRRGDKSAFRKLQELVEENSDNPSVIKQLGHSYRYMGELKRATDTFLLAKDKYNVGDAEKRHGLIDAHIQAASCLADDDDLNGALVMLTNLLFDSNFHDFKARIFKAMAEISKLKDDIERFFIYAEAALDIDPCDTDFRYEVAFAYSENNENQLSLLHYKKATTAGSSHALNNLGVQYNRLELKSKCVESYFESAGHDETLAMANLAQKYLNEGFLNDAQELINRANKLGSEGVKIDYNIGTAQKRLIDIKKEEYEKEQKLLAEAEKERKFRASYSKAFCSETTIAKENIEGSWETPWGAFELVFKEETNSFSINGKKQIETGALASLFTPPGQEPPPKTYKDRYVNITGTIEKMSGKYNIEVDDKRKPAILTGGKVHEATGYMVINGSYDCIEIMEKTEDGKKEFIQWKKQ